MKCPLGFRPAKCPDGNVSSWVIPRAVSMRMWRIIFGKRKEEIPPTTSS